MKTKQKLFMASILFFAYTMGGILAGVPAKLYLGMATMGVLGWVVGDIGMSSLFPKEKDKGL